MSDTADPDDGACRQARMRLALSSFVRRGSLWRASRAIAYRPIASSCAGWLGGNTRFACGGPASTGSRSTGTAGLRAHLRFGFCYTVASAAAATSRACSSLRLSHWRLLCGPSSGSNRPLHFASQSPPRDLGGRQIRGSARCQPAARAMTVESADLEARRHAGECV